MPVISASDLPRTGRTSWPNTVPTWLSLPIFCPSSLATSADASQIPDDSVEVALQLPTGPLACRAAPSACQPSPPSARSVCMYILQLPTRLVRRSKDIFWRVRGWIGQAHLKSAGRRRSAGGVVESGSSPLLACCRRCRTHASLAACVFWGSEKPFSSFAESVARQRRLLPLRKLGNRRVGHGMAALLMCSSELLELLPDLCLTACTVYPT